MSDPDLSGSLTPDPPIGGTVLDPPLYGAVVTVEPVEVDLPGGQGLPGPPGAKGDKGDAGSENPVYVAAAVVSGDKALMFAAPGTVIHADPAAPDYVYAGVALSAAQPGGSVAAATVGDVTASFWAWTPFAPVFVTAGGNLTQSPPSAGRSHLIGWALDATTIHLAPDPIVTFA